MKVPMNHYVYFVSFHFSKRDGREGTGYRSIHTEAKANTEAWCESVCDHLIKSNGFTQIALITWKRLKGSERWEKLDG